MTSDSNERPRRQRRPRPANQKPLTGEVLPPAAAYGAEEIAIGAEEESLLRNPYVLAALAVAGAIVLAVFVVIIFGSSGEGGTGRDREAPGLGGLPTQPAGRGVRARSIATSTVREGPSTEYLETGVLRSGQDVEVAGRNPEASWFQIFYPTGSQLRGWVPASALRLADGAQLAVVAVTPIPRPTVILPSPTPEPPATAVPTATVTETPPPSTGADLAVRLVSACTPGQRLLIIIRNLGPQPLTSRPLQVAVQAPDGTPRALVSLSPLTLPVGQEAAVDTTYVVQERVIAIVDPLGATGDPNPSNNRVDCVPAGPQIPGTPASPTRRPGDG